MKKHFRGEILRSCHLKGGMHQICAASICSKFMGRNFSTLLTNLARQGMTKHLSYICLSSFVLRCTNKKFTLNFCLNGLASVSNLHHFRKRLIWPDAHEVKTMQMRSPSKFSHQGRTSPVITSVNTTSVNMKTSSRIERKRKKAITVRYRAKPAAQLIATKYRRMCRERRMISASRMARTDIQQLPSSLSPAEQQCSCNVARPTSTSIFATSRMTRWLQMEHPFENCN